MVSLRDRPLQDLLAQSSGCFTTLMGLWAGNLKSRVCSLVASSLAVGTHTAGLEGPLPGDSAGKSAPEDSSAGVVVGAPVGDLSALGWSRSCRLALGCRIRCFSN